MGIETDVRRRWVELLTDLVRKQELLLGALRASLDSLPGRQGWLEDVRRVRAIEVAGETWSTMPHGGGVQFRARATGELVDVPGGLEDPGLLDEWRLGAHLGSLGRRGQKLVGSTIGRLGEPLEVGVARCVEELVDAGVLVRERNAFRISESAGR